MKHQEILTKAIDKAKANGWEDPIADIAIEAIDENSNMWHRGWANAFIFSHDFAKALWGDESKFKEAIERFNPTHQDELYFPEYKYHLQQMVIAPDPIKYLGENI